MDAVFRANGYTLLRRQTSMNNAVTVIFARRIVQRRLQCARRLIKGCIPDRVHFDLQTSTIRRLAKINHLLVRVIQNATAANRIIIAVNQRGIMTSKATVKRTFETPSVRGSFRFVATPTTIDWGNTRT